MFMEAQGYKLTLNILAEDNESTTWMSKNGRESCTSNSKHIAINYFWVTNRIKNGNIKIVHHCPTKQMVSDYFTKPLQGALFHMFRNVIMGWAHTSTVYAGYAVSKEHVGNNENEVKYDKNKYVEKKAYVNNESLDTTSQAVKNKNKSYAEAVNSQNKKIKQDRDTAYKFNESKGLIKLKQSSFN